MWLTCAPVGMTIAWFIVLLLISSPHGVDGFKSVVFQTTASRSSHISAQQRMVKTERSFHHRQLLQQKSAGIFFLQGLLKRSSHSSTSALQQASSGETDQAADGGFDLAAWFNLGTRGGIMVWSVILTLIPIGVYNYYISQGYEDTTVGAYVGAFFVLLTLVAWGSTYIFRVANKDMTYAKQLRDYENAVLQKRLEELADDEIDALMKEIEQEDVDGGSKAPSN